MAAAGADERRQEENAMEWGGEDTEPRYREVFVLPGKTGDCGTSHSKLRHDWPSAQVPLQRGTSTFWRTINGPQPDFPAAIVSYDLSPAQAVEPPAFCAVSLALDCFWLWNPFLKQDWGDAMEQAGSVCSWQ
ncbi:hypothetical protein KM043_012835 [Ampulex compressa]|nr:hypothetical protein KM043_012835 [Ampulex compressa]